MGPHPQATVYRSSGQRRICTMLTRNGAECYLCGLPLVDIRIDSNAERYRGSNAQREHADVPTIDHVHPLALGGKRNAANERLACGPCNTRKASMTLAEHLDRFPNMCAPHRLPELRRMA